MWKRFFDALDRNTEWKVFRHVKTAGDVFAYFGAFVWLATAVGAVMSYIAESPWYVKLMLGLLAVILVLAASLFRKLLRAPQATDDESAPVITGSKTRGIVGSLGITVAIVLAIVISSRFPLPIRSTTTSTPASDRQQPAREGTISARPDTVAPKPKMKTTKQSRVRSTLDNTTKAKSDSREVPTIAVPPAVSSNNGTAVGSVTVQPGGAASFGQQGGITAGKIEVNPLPLERTWQLSPTKCDEWLEKLSPFGPTKISIGAFISNNDGIRVVGILTACFERPTSNWKPQWELLPANPNGVEIGASQDGMQLDTLAAALGDFGIRVTRRDIRPTYGTGIGIVVGTDPIKQQQ